MGNSHGNGRLAWLCTSGVLPSSHGGTVGIATNNLEPSLSQTLVAFRFKVMDKLKNVRCIGTSSHYRLGLRQTLCLHKTALETQVFFHSHNIA